MFSNKPNFKTSPACSSDPTMNVNDDDEEEQRPLTTADIRALLDEQDARHKEEIRLQEERINAAHQEIRQLDRRFKDLERASASSSPPPQDAAGATQTNDEIPPFTDNPRTSNNQLTPNRLRRGNTARLSFLFFRRGRNEGGSGGDHDDEAGDDRSEGLEEDTFSLMMMNKPFREIPCCHPTFLAIICVAGFLGIFTMYLAYDITLLVFIFVTSNVMMFGPLSCPWLLSMLTFFWLQLFLGFIIIIDQTLLQSDVLGCNHSDTCVPFKIPVNNAGMAIPQYLVVFFALATQNDIFSSLQTLGKLRNADNVPWDIVIGQPGNRTWGLWICRILLPNIFKFIQASVILFATFVLIIQTTSIVDLLKDFTSLLVVSEADNIMFHIASLGYFGENLQKKTEEVKAVRWMIVNNTRGEGDADGNEQEKPQCWHSCCNMGSCFFLTLAMVMIGGLTYVVVGQYNGRYMRMKYPECDVRYPQQIGDGWCLDWPPFNTAECGWDGGDCPEPTNVEGYINCTVSFPEKIGNGKCDDFAPYNTTECSYDGSDCNPPH